MTDFLEISNDSGYIAVIVPEFSDTNYMRSIETIISMASESMLADFPYDWTPSAEERELLRPSIQRLVLRRHENDVNDLDCGCEAPGWFCSKGDGAERFNAYGLQEAVIVLNDFYLKHHDFESD